MPEYVRAMGRALNDALKHKVMDIVTGPEQQFSRRSYLAPYSLTW